MSYESLFNTNKDKDKILENLDMSKVDSIVNRIKSKYEKQGILGGSETNLKELRSIISEGKRARIEILKPSDLSFSFNPSVRFVGNIYTKLGFFFEFLSKKVLGHLPDAKLLSFELYSADINYSAAQYLAISSVVLFFVNLIIFLGLMFIFMVLSWPVWIAVILTIFIVIFGCIFALKYPTMIAKQRAKEIDSDLPFALRHMSTLLKAGVDLYKVIRTIAGSDYGTLSKEMTKTVLEVDEGADIKDALRALSLRTKSFALKNAINHVLRALKSGGNLSEVMSTIANDVSYQIMSEIEAFSGKMNFFGVIYIFIGIVVPVMTAILSGIRNAPLGGNASFFAALPFTPLIIMLTFFVVFPFILFLLIIYIKSIKPTM